MRCTSQRDRVQCPVAAGQRGCAGDRAISNRSAQCGRAGQRRRTPFVVNRPRDGVATSAVQGHVQRVHTAGDAGAGVDINSPGRIQGKCASPSRAAVVADDDRPPTISRAVNHDGASQGLDCDVSRVDEIVKCSINHGGVNAGA